MEGKMNHLGGVGVCLVDAFSLGSDDFGNQIWDANLIYETSDYDYTSVEAIKREFKWVKSEYLGCFNNGPVLGEVNPL